MTNLHSNLNDCSIDDVFFSLVAFKIFILYLVFSKLIMTYLGICFIGFILFSVC